MHEDSLVTAPESTKMKALSRLPSQTMTGTAPFPRRAHRSTGLQRIATLALSAASALLANPASALEYGPFSLTGFAKFEAIRASNQCTDCQRFPDEDRHRLWADALVPGKSYGSQSNTLTLFQPFLAANFDLGGGVRLSGLLSQRWRDGSVDIRGFWYEKNVALSHENWGRIAIGAMPTRAWAMADYPFGTDVGMADAWASSGAGYGLNTHAIRITSRPMDVGSGDLVAEITYDQGNTDFKRNKPRFIEVWLQYKHRELMLDLMLQDTRNGTPMGWGHGPFTGLTPFAADDSKLGGSGQAIAMAMARYELSQHWKLQAGVRSNRWSGAYAVITQFGSPSLWNNMFNVDWNGQLNGVPNPGYAATSTDFTLGARYQDGPLSYHAGWTHLGKAKTANPSERGQSNSANVLAVGAGYEVQPGVRLYALAGAVFYSRLGLAPLSMPSHSAFTGIDSRIARNGNWAGLGAVYTF